MIIFEKNLNIWKKYPNFYGYFSVFLVIFLFIISGLSGLSGFIHPKFLILVEFIKRIYLPSFLSSWDDETEIAIPGILELKELLWIVSVENFIPVDLFINEMNKKVCK